MRKFTNRFLLVSLILLSCQISFAQIGFGPRLGLNMANQVGVNTNGKTKLGLVLGGYAKFNMGEKAAFQPELLFSMKGYTLKSPGFEGVQSSNYIDVPLLLNLGKSQGLHWLIGVQPSFLLSAKAKSKPSTGSATTVDDKDLYKGFDMGILTGLGYQLESGLNFDFRFTYGATPVFTTASGYPKIHNINMQFTVGYTLGN
jgi:hypothetical protein